MIVDTCVNPWAMVVKLAAKSFTFQIQEFLELIKKSQEVMSHDKTLSTKFFRNTSCCSTEHFLRTQIYELRYDRMRK